MTNYNLHREPGDELLSGCEHDTGEDCMNCAICGLCKESLDDDDVCDDCRKGVGDEKT